MPDGASETDSAGLPVPAFATTDLHRTDDLDVFRDRLNDAFYPARVERCKGAADQTPSQFSARRMTFLTIGFVRAGADLLVDPGPLGGYHVNVPVAGRVESWCGSRRIVAEPGHAAVFTPDEHTKLSRWSADAAQVCIKIRRQALEHEAGLLLGRPLRRPLDFDIGLDLASPRGRSWLATLRLLLEELRQPAGLANASTTYRETIERLVIGGIVLAAHSSIAANLPSESCRLRPRTVTRVLELIEADPAAPYVVADLAAHAGVSARRLQQSFREHVGTTPMMHLRAVRLERARRDLRETDLPIGAIAASWGFGNLGRFAAAYREAYGASPVSARRGR